MCKFDFGIRNNVLVAHVLEKEQLKMSVKNLWSTQNSWNVISWIYCELGLS